MEASPVIAGSVVQAHTSPPLPAVRPRAAGRGPGPYSVLAPLRTNLSIDNPRVRAPLRQSAQIGSGSRLQAGSRCAGGLFVEPVCESSEIAAIATWARLAHVGQDARQVVPPAPGP